MKAFAAVSLALVACPVFAQKQPKLEPAQPVDIRADSVQWHPKGNALIYRRQEENGFGIGIYRIGDPEGRVVVHLKTGDTWDAEWFEGSTNALIVVHRKVQTPQGAANEGDVYLVDSKLKTAYEVFSRQVMAPDDISVDVDLSPYLNHAIFTIQEGKKSYHAVLPINGGKLLTSPDIDQAVAQGYSGPSWSKDGTAIFGNAGGAQQFFGSLGGKSVGGKQSADQKAGTVTFEISDAKISGMVLDDLKGQLTSFFLKLAPMAPPIGTPVLEVVPSNGVLRQVRSPGPWVETTAPESTVTPRSHPVHLDFGRSRGEANSLWLIAGDKDNPTAVLVAAQAQEAILAPQDKAIAYVTDGALFVRRISAEH